MKNSTRILLSLVLGVALFAADGYPAEERPKQAKVMTEAEVGAAWQRRIPEIDLGDQLPLAEVAKNLGERFREVNFVVPERARSEAVPRLVLRNVTLGEILKAIELASEGRIRGGLKTARSLCSANRDTNVWSCWMK